MEGTSTEQLYAALAAIERSESGEDTSVRATETQSLTEDDVVNRALEPITTAILDATIGRCLSMEFDSHSFHAFVELTRAEILKLLKSSSLATEEARRAWHRRNRYVTSSESASDKAEVTSTQRELQEAILGMQRELDSTRTERDQARESQNFLRTLGTELISDVSGKTHQVANLQKTLSRRDQLLTDQRRAYYRELTHLRGIIRQWETRGGAMSSADTTFYNWAQDDLAEQLKAEQTAEVEAAVAEERARYEREIDVHEAKHAKQVEELRRAVTNLESQLRSARAVPAPSRPIHHDVGTATYVPRCEQHVQTEPMTTLSVPDGKIADERASPELGEPRQTPSKPDGPASQANRAVEAAVETCEIPSKPYLANVVDAKLCSGIAPKPATDAPPAGLPLWQGRSSTVDDETFRNELTELRVTISSLQSQIKNKENALADAAKLKLDTDEAHRRAEQQAIRRLQEEVRMKDGLLDKKGRELTQLQEEAQRWFAQYKESQPVNSTPVNYSTLRKLTDTVRAAEFAEEAYRVSAWELLAYRVKQKLTLEALRSDCAEAEVARDTVSVRNSQRAFDALAHKYRADGNRLRQIRVRLRDDANRLWDTVLYFSRSVHHASDPATPPPRYYSSQVAVEPLQHVSTSTEQIVGLHAHTRPSSRHVVSRPERPSRPSTANPKKTPFESTSTMSPYVTKLRSGIACVPREAMVMDGSNPTTFTSTPVRPTFAPSHLTGRSLAEQRQTLVRLMKYDQDMLAATRRRHVHAERRAGRGVPFGSAELGATFVQQKLIGRNEAHVL
jgi:hypothetical protein